MERLASVAEMEVGGIYNLVYVGENKAYARVNGKRTILVIATEPEFQYVQLYQQFASPTTDDLRSSLVTCEDAPLAFKNDEIFQPVGEDEWFKHSLRVTSLEEAISQGVLTKEDVFRHPVRSRNSPFVGVSDSDGRFVGLYTDFGVQDKTVQPYLQTVYVWWDTWEDMRADFKKYGVIVPG
jgi:hypothetical protein